MLKAYDHDKLVEELNWCNKWLEKWEKDPPVGGCGLLVVNTLKGIKREVLKDLGRYENAIKELR